jgi:hypothetical protein
VQRCRSAGFRQLPVAFYWSRQTVARGAVPAVLCPDPDRSWGLLVPGSLPVPASLGLRQLQVGSVQCLFPHATARKHCFENKVDGSRGGGEGGSGPFRSEKGSMSHRRSKQHEKQKPEGPAQVETAANEPPISLTIWLGQLPCCIGRGVQERKTKCNVKSRQATSCRAVNLMRARHCPRWLANRLPHPVLHWLPASARLLLHRAWIAGSESESDQDERRGRLLGTALLRA